jgi:2'-hydroxyisoflavone reductase
MKTLVLGGSVFLSRAVAEAAVARGHDVVAVTRGRSGTVPDGVRHVVADRADPLPADLAGMRFDAVVDVARMPSHVRRAVAAWPDARWVLVSTISVYADDADPAGPGSGRLHPPQHDDVDLAADPGAYGPMKVACEEIVREGTVSSVVVRPGLIVGPGDPTGRFTYWPARLGRAGRPVDAAGDAHDEVLAPGSPDAVVQVLDVRDLATWLVDLAEQSTDGTYDAVGPAQPFAALLDDVARGSGATPAWTWIDDDRLAAADVQPWAGPRSLPLWVPRPDYDGMLAHDAGPALAAGLRPRPVEDTARDVLAWLRRDTGAVVTGLTADEEAEVLRQVAPAG